MCIRDRSKAYASFTKEVLADGRQKERLYACLLYTSDLEKILQPEKYTGRAKEQTEDFLAELVQPVLDKYADIE